MSKTWKEEFKYDQRRVGNLVVFLLDYSHSGGEAEEETADTSWTGRVGQMIVALTNKLQRWAYPMSIGEALKKLSKPAAHSWKNGLLSDPLEQAGTCSHEPGCMPARHHERAH